MSKDDDLIRYRLRNLKTDHSKEVIAAIIGYIRNGANDMEIYYLTNVKTQDIKTIRDAIKKNLL